MKQKEQVKVLRSKNIINPSTTKYVTNNLTVNFGANRRLVGKRLFYRN